jgi:hypothetical protein
MNTKGSVAEEPGIRVVNELGVPVNVIFARCADGPAVEFYDARETYPSPHGRLVRRCSADRFLARNRALPVALSRDDAELFLTRPMAHCVDCFIKEFLASPAPAQESLEECRDRVVSLIADGLDQAEARGLWAKDVLAKALALHERRGQDHQEAGPSAG